MYLWLKKDESSYYSFSNDFDLRIRSKFKSMSKNEKKLEQLRFLYKMMENNSYVLEEDAILVPNIDLRKCAETQI